MLIRNYLTAKLEDLPNCHDGTGVLKHIALFGERDFAVPVRFFNYTVLPPGTTIGNHKHGNDEEFYVILEGKGMMTMEGESKEVIAGDVIVNKPHGSHGLANHSKKDLKILVFEVYK